MSNGHYGIGAILGAIMAGVGSSLYVNNLADRTTSLALIVCGALTIVLAVLGLWRAKK